MTTNTPTSRVLVVYSGGTIGMSPSDPHNPASPLIPFTTRVFVDLLPKSLQDLNMEWHLQPLRDESGKDLPPLDSSDVNGRHWQYMAQAIYREYDNYDGFVLLHGTDTMAYTASALAFMLRNLSKPVVVSGSQLPLGNPRTDAVSNLVNALCIAGYRAFGLPRIPEVVLSFADVVLRGCRARKVSTSSWRGFESPNFPALGTIGEHIVIDQSLLSPVPDSISTPFFIRPELEDNVVDVSLYPGMGTQQIEALFSLPRLRGVLLRTFGAGNTPSSPEFLSVVERAIRRDVVVVNITQCIQGRVEAGLYESSSRLQDIGVLNGCDMSPEAAMTKMMCLLANEPISEAGPLMQIALAGEMSESIYDLKFHDCFASSGRVIVSSSPQGTFRRRDLNRATLLVQSVSSKEQTPLNVFVNHPQASMNTPVSEPRFACEISASPNSRLYDVTATVQRVAEDGRAITLTIVSSGGEEFTLKHFSLLLACQTR